MYIRYNSKEDKRNKNKKPVTLKKLIWLYRFGNFTFGIGIDKNTIEKIHRSPDAWILKVSDIIIRKIQTITFFIRPLFTTAAI